MIAVMKNIWRFDMPSKYDKIPLPREADKRVKFSQATIDKAVNLYNNGLTQKEIAQKLGVSKSSVGYWVNPNAKKHLAEYKKKHPSRRRSKEEANSYIRDLRRRKKMLKEVDFESYCFDCKHYFKKESEHPCCDCLECSFKEDSHRPVYWEEK